MKGLILAGLLALTLAACEPPPGVQIGDPLRVDNEAPPGTCHEDDPCWDCSTMGNQICGPIQAVETITLTSCHTPDGYPFTYIGPIDTAPWEACGLPPLLQKGSK